MSVMENLRSGSDSTFMQVILALVLLSFVGWFAAPQSGDKASIVATVNGEPILDTKLIQEFSRREQSSQRALDDTQRAQLRESIRQELIEEAVLLQEAEALGLEISDREIARSLLQIAAFKDKSGKFDKEKYANYLRSRQTSQAAFEDELRQDLLLQKLRMLIYQGASVSEPVLREAYIAQNTKIDVEYVRVRASAFVEGIDIPEAERTEWLAKNEAAAKAAYDRDFARLYDLPTKLTLSVLRLEKKGDGEDVVKRIEALRAQLDGKGEAAFAEAARRWSEEPTAGQGGDMGEQLLSSLSTEVQSVLSAVGAGQLSAPVQTEADVRIFLVRSRTEARKVPFEEVRGEIARRLIAEERSPAAAQAFATKTLESWRAGALPVAEMAERKLTLQETGLIPAAGGGGAFAPPARMLAAAGRAQGGEVLPEVYEEGGVLWVARLRVRQDADLGRFDEEKAAIRESVLAERRMAFYQGWVADAVASASVQ